MDLVHEGDERACELAVRPRVADLCAEVRVYADEGNALRLCDLSRLGESFAGADRCAELAINRPRHQVRVRVHLDARRDPEPYGLRSAPAVREPGEPLDVMRTIDDEAADARRESSGNLVVRLRVAVQLHPRYRKTRAPRGLQLSERRDAGVDASWAMTEPTPIRAQALTEYATRTGRWRKKASTYSRRLARIVAAS